MQRTGPAPILRSCISAALTAALALTAQVVFSQTAVAAGTTLTVSTTADVSTDAGACGDVDITMPPSPLSLREATCLADNLGGDVTITVPAGVYRLTGGELRLGGEPGQRISLVGAGQASTVIDAGHASRVLELDFNLTGGIDINISGVTVRGGSDTTWGGAGIIAGSGTSDSLDSLTISDSTITDNQTSPDDATATGYPGGGLQFVGGSLTISNSTISSNSSGSSPGSGVFYQGLGVAGGEQLSVTGSTFSGNGAVANGLSNGGALALGGAGYDVSSTRFVGNTVTAGSGGTARGAGIWLRSGALTATGNTFTGNSTVGSSGGGGAIAMEAGSAVVHYNRFSDNAAASGSAVSTGGATVTATENWWGCGGGPGSTGCDSVSGGLTVSPWLTLTASANPAALVGPNATSAITASLTRDSLGDAVAPAHLGAFDGAPVSWTDPQPAGATVSAASTHLASGSASTIYDSNATAGAGQVTAGLDHGSATAAVTVTIANQPPAIVNDPTDQTVSPGTSVTFTAAANGTPTPTVQWQRSTDGGASFADVAGATSPSYTFTTVAGDDGNQYRVVFTNLAGTSTSAAATVHVGTAPAFTSADHTTFVVDQGGSFAVTATGWPSPVLSRTGIGFPAWLTLTDNGDGTGSLAGTPPAGGGGSYSFTLKASDGFSPSAVQTFTLFVDASPVITSADHTTFTAGAANTFAVSTTAGYPTTTAISELGSLPSGVTFRDNGDGTAMLSGTPDVDTGGSYLITLRATAGLAPVAAQSFTLVVNEPPRIISANHATFAVGTAGSFTVTTADGNPSATALTKAGMLPVGITFVDKGDGTATVAGAAGVGSGGVYAIIITASNGVAPNASQSFTLTVNEPPHFTSMNHASFTVGSADSFTATTSAGEPNDVTITESGALPSGVSFTDNGDGTATLGGTAGAGGSYPITITVTNSAGHSDQSFTLTVTDAPVITSADHTTFTVGTHGSFTVTTTPGTPADTSLAETGSLPGGVRFTDNGDGTATLTGTPAAGSGGSYSLTITASNGGSQSSTQSFTLTVTDVPVVTSANHATFTVGTSGSFTVTTRAGYPTSDTVTEAGSLPSGVSFTDNGDGTATLAGTPAAGTGGSYPITITTTNSAGHSDQAFTLTVTESPAITSADHVTFDAGHAGRFTVTTSGGFPAHPALTETGALPSGVTFHDNGDGTAALTGTSPTAAGGTYPLTITASNGTVSSGSQAFTLTVTAVGSSGLPT